MVPAGLKVMALTPLLVRVAEDLSDGLYVSSGHEFLCVRDPDCLLDEDTALEDYDIGNGDRLVMLQQPLTGGPPKNRSRRGALRAFTGETL